jgi:phospholipase C
VDTDIVDGKTLLGMRVPGVVASPFSSGNPANPLINPLVYDHTSVLKLIEWRWGLQPLTPRDASSDVNNLAYALNFDSPQTAVPALPEPKTPFFVLPCFQTFFSGLTSSDVARQETVLHGAPAPSAVPPSAVPLTSTKKTAVWRDLRALAQNNGFTVR